jgi:hypothetical protein
MKDIQTHLKKIRSDAAECLVLSSLATDGKREVFIRIAEHLNALALELETSTKIGADGGDASKLDNAAVFNLPPKGPRQAAAWTPRRMLSWMLVLILVGTSGTLIWTNSPAEKYRFFMQSKQEPTPQDNSNEAVALRFSAEQAERKLLSARMTALTGRLDDIESSLDSLKKARDETTEALNPGFAGAAETRPPTAATSPPPSVEKPVSTTENSTLKAESPTSPKQPEAVGPPGCSQFRSFDSKSGTYVTLDGRRRQCR